MTAGSTDERGIKTQVSAETYQAFVDILHHELVVATGCTEPIAVAYASALATKTLGSEPDRCVSAETYQAFVDILHHELVVATGCTEPIAVAYASALATKTLGSEPDRCVAAVSGNIIKNVNSVTVPNTGGMRGVKASVAAGVTVGNSDNLLDVLGDVDDDGRVRIQEYLSNHEIKVKIAETDEPFYVSIHAYAGDDFAHVIMDKSHTNVAFVAKNGEVILDAVKIAETDEPFYVSIHAYAGDDFAHVIMDKSHTNVAFVAKNGEVILDAREDGTAETERTREYLNLADIVAFAEHANLEDVRGVLERQIEYNCAIAEEGLKNDWGARVGKLYLTSYDKEDVLICAKAAAAAGSDARMSGCPMPVVIVSGSGNQGITASAPIAVYAKEYDVDHDTMLRGLIIADLVSVYQKMGIGCLSAFCGAVSAGTGAAAGIVYMLGGDMEDIEHTIVNALGVVSGGMRRREALMRGEDRRIRRERHLRLPPVQKRQPVHRRRRHRHHGRRRDHPKRQPHGPRGHAPNRPRDSEHHDRRVKEAIPYSTLRMLGPPAPSSAGRA